MSSQSEIDPCQRTVRDKVSNHYPKILNFRVRIRIRFKITTRFRVGVMVRVKDVVRVRKVFRVKAFFNVSAVHWGLIVKIFPQ